MFRQRIVPLVADAREVVRPLCISIIALVLIVGFVAVKGWHGDTAALAILGAGISMAVVLQVHKAIQSLHRQSSDVQQAAAEAEKHYIDVLLRIIHFVEARDKYSVGRAERIGRLSHSMARKLGLDDDLCYLMGVAGQLHDIGLMAVPESILNKPGSLGQREFGTVQKHCQIAFEMLKPLKMLDPVLLAVRHHHERMNGTGYPDGLAGEKITLEARILAVADAYDAMTHDRPHRGAMSPLEALGELRRCTPSGFDESCVEALAQILHMPASQQTAARCEEAATY